MNYEERVQKTGLVTNAFRPGTPIDILDLFAGRQKQIQTVIRAVLQQGQHAIIFGEKGVGKTSMARIMASLLRNTGSASVSTGTINCDGTDDFSGLWHKIFRELEVVIEMRRIGFDQKPDKQMIVLENFLPKRKITPDDVRYALTRALEASNVGDLVIVIDEVDRLATKETTVQLADTIKNLSDHAVRTTIILVGVADAVDQLIEGHASIERALVQVKMPRMSDSELHDIINRGLGRCNMTIDPSARDQIVKLSQGLPHFTHQLSLSSAMIALDQERTYIQANDLSAAMTDAISNSHSLLSEYCKAVASPQSESLYAEVLLACAVAMKDELGWFTAAAVSTPYSKLRGGKHHPAPYYSRHLNEFCMEKRGPVLQRDAQGRGFRYRFVNPLMQPFVIIHAQAAGPPPHVSLRQEYSPDGDVDGHDAALKRKQELPSLFDFFEGKSEQKT